MEITFLGQATTLIKLQGHTLLIDPFIKENPHTKVAVDDLKPDYIILTHMHHDHNADLVEIAERTGATLISQLDIARFYDSTYQIKIAPLNAGGTFVAPDQSFSVMMHPAVHASQIGVPLSVSLMAEGKHLYHAGDTALFSDMKLINRRQAIDLAMLPIGGSLTMDAQDAVLASQWLAAKKVIPMHYNTFPAIMADPVAFVANLDEQMGAGTGFIPTVDLPFEL